MNADLTSTDPTDPAGAGLGAEVTGLTVRFGRETALAEVDVGFRPGTITGLLGRNGAGKTTLLRVLAAYERATSGRVLVGGANPFENEQIMTDVCLVRDTGNVSDDSRISEEIELCELLRPRWDTAFAARLLDRFELSARQRVGTLSRGQKSALAIVIGLASRAPLTMFDEPHLGLDAPSRAAFYDELLADYIDHPRTIVLSTHLIDEVAPLLEDVVVLHRGRVIEHASAEELRSRGAQVVGAAEAVDAFLATLPSHSVLHTRRLGPTVSATVFVPVDATTLNPSAADLEIGPLPLQDLFIALTDKEGAAHG